MKRRGQFKIQIDMSISISYNMGNRRRKHFHTRRTSRSIRVARSAHQRGAHRWTSRPRRAYSGDSMDDDSGPNDKPRAHEYTHNYTLNNPCMMFRDQTRLIDAVLVYEDTGDITEARHRRNFEDNLEFHGLHLEYEEPENSFDGKTAFVKVHIPADVQKVVAERLEIQHSVKRIRRMTADDPVDVISKQPPVVSPPDPMVDHVRTFDEAYGNFHKEAFLIKERYKDFSPSVRSFLAMQILLRASYNTESKRDFGIRRLLNLRTYKACFPLHDACDLDEAQSVRKYLLNNWASLRNIFKPQPLYLIKWYFGQKTAVYFSWCGFYLKMLSIASILGVLSFIFGLATMDTDLCEPSKDICEASQSTYVCPVCENHCTYKKLSSYCVSSYMSWTCDNEATAALTVFMIFWARIVLALWKRKLNVHRWEWDLTGNVPDTDYRPEFEAAASFHTIDPITKQKEPAIPRKERIGRIIVSVSGILFLFATIVFVTLCIILYEVAISVYAFGKSDQLMSNPDHVGWFGTISTAVISFVFIVIMQFVSRLVAKLLTDYELPRTQTEYENSYFFKLTFFEFTNLYSSLIYIAFFKGKFYTHPGDCEHGKSLMQMKSDLCGPEGCHSVLMIQLLAVLSGRLVTKLILELGRVKIFKASRESRLLKTSRKPKELFEPWELDYFLPKPDPMQLHRDYLAMVMQFGFVTMFVSAFPLAPLLALIYNLFRVRLDAYKLLVTHRRSFSELVQRGPLAWFGTLRVIAVLSVAMNAFFLGITSELVPQTLYYYMFSKKRTLRGYLSHTLSSFNTSHFTHRVRQAGDPEICYYTGYRRRHDHPKRYERSTTYWQVMTARLLFIIIFEHFFFGLTELVGYIIPDVPAKLQKQLEREYQILKDANDKKMEGDGPLPAAVMRRVRKGKRMLEKAMHKLAGHHQHISNNKIDI